MGRGVSAGGGQSSLGYLFGGGETPTPQPPPPKDPIAEPSSESPVVNPPQVDNNKPTPTQTPTPTPIPPPPSTGYTTNNYYRVDGQNCGNFITDRPSTKVHAAPGGGSSLDYLFGNDKK